MIRFPLMLLERRTNEAETWHGVMHIADRPYRCRVTVSVAHKSATSSSSDGGAEHESLKDDGHTSLLLLSTHAQEVSAQKRSASMPHIQLQVEEELARLAQGCQPMLRQRWAENPSLSAFLTEFSQLLTRIIRSSQTSSSSNTTPLHPLPAATALPPVSLYSSLLKDLSALEGGMSSVADIDAATARHLTLISRDSRNRSHLMHVDLSETYPSHGLISVTVDLPIPFDAPAVSGSTSASLPVPHAAATSVSSKAGHYAIPIAPSSTTVPSTPSTLVALYSRFTHLIHQCQPVWDALDDMDSACIVLDPEKPIRRSACHRRIVIGVGCTLELKIDPLKPNALPIEINCFGDDNKRKAMEARIEAGMWKDEEDQGSGDRMSDDEKGTTTNATTSTSPCSLRRNLLRLLDMESFPLPPTTVNGAGGDMGMGMGGELDEFNLSCSICMEYHLEGVSPNYHCANCHRPFHRSCLIEWLLSLPTTQSAFNQLYGTCIYCQEKIAVPQQA